MTGLHQIEADIQLCEQFLKMDGGDVPKTAEASGSSAPLVSAAAEPATTSGGATASMSQQRRKEILDRLLAERKATKQRQSDAAAHGSTVGCSGCRTKKVLALAFTLFTRGDLPAVSGARCANGHVAVT